MTNRVLIGLFSAMLDSTMVYWTITALALQTSLQDPHFEHISARIK
jgi:hypothetical protein